MKRVPGGGVARLRSWRASGAALLLLLSATAAGATSAPIVREIDFQYDAWVGRRGLAGLLPFRVGEPLESGDLEVAEERLEQTGIFRSVDVASEEMADGVRFVARLRRKPVIARVRVQGYEGVRLNELRWLVDRVTFGTLGGYKRQELGRVEMRRLVQLREGVLFEPVMLQQAEQRILERFHKMGYVFTQVASRVHEDNGTVDIHLRIDPGQPLVVAEVQIAGSCVPLAEWEPILEPFVGQPRSRDLERRLRAALLRHLREKNFYEARVKTTWQPSGDLRGSVLAELTCGLVHELAFTGNRHASSDDLRDVVDLEGRLIISDNTWRLMARRMEALYQGKGYYKAAVTPSIEEVGEGKRVTFAVDEGRSYRLRKIDFTGNDHVRRSELREQMETRPARALPWPRRGAVVKDDLAEDAGRIEALYEERGFESAQVSSEVAEQGEAGDLVLHVQIDEGPPTIVRRVEPQDFPSPITTEQPLVTVIDQPLRRADLESDRNALLAAWRALGHRDARVDFEVERKPGGDEVAAVVHWVVEPGPRFVIGPIVVQENVTVRDELLLREMPFESGDPLRVESLLQGQERIYSLGLFRSVSVVEVEDESDLPDDEDGEDAAEGPEEPAEAAQESSPAGARGEPAAAMEEAGEEAAPHADGAAQDDVVVPIGIRVTPRAPGRLSYGGGYNTRDGITGFAELSYDNLARRARTIRLRGEMSLEPPSFTPSQYLAGLTYVDPRFTGSPWELQLGVVGERNTRTVSEYSIERAALGASASRRVFSRMRVGADMQLELARVFDVDPIPFADRDAEHSRTTAIGGFIAYDRRNDAFNPASGFINSLRAHYAPPGLSNVDFVQIDAEHTHFFPLGDYVGFVISLRAGWVRTFDDPIVPIRRRYFVGGGESVRGFAVNHLGPYDGEGNNIGGDLAVVARSELRVPIAWGFGLALFVDGGGNFLLRCDRSCREGDPTDEATRVHDADPSLRNFRRTAGVGLRYVSPVGPISVDYGIKLDRRTRHLAEGETDRESFGEFSVSIGARF